MKYEQISLFDDYEEKVKDRYSKADVLDNVRSLYRMWKAGELGGEFMPEDSNPRLEISTEDNYLYFTLPMALNYQRNSYKLWEAALKMFNDKETNYLFSPHAVIEQDYDKIKEDLVKYKVALQPNKQTSIWITLCQTIVTELRGSIKNLFRDNNYTARLILEEIQKKKKKLYPYLSGGKIANYWLYVLSNYTSLELKDKENISIAPDTHVIQATYKLGLVDNINESNIQEHVAQIWRDILDGTEFSPIDIHTPLWLWSRGGFTNING